MKNNNAVGSHALRIVNKFFPSVTKVTDATEKTMIEVTARDAASKAVKDHGACVMAVACKRKFHLSGVIISRSVAYLIKYNEATRYYLPSSVAKEIVSFDRGAGFEVGTYELSSIPKLNRLGARAGRELDPDRERKDKSKRFRHLTTNVRAVLGGERPLGE